MKLSENRKLAWVVLAVAVIVSVFGLGGAKLAREQEALIEQFYEGTDADTTRECMDAYLDRALDCAQVMASEAKLRLGADNATAARVDEAIASFGDDDTLDERYGAYTTLQGLSDELYNRFFDGSVAEAERVNFKRAYDDFWGADKYIQRDPYRKAARNFNDSLRGFPAGLVAGLWGIDALNTFGG